MSELLATMKEKGKKKFNTHKFSTVATIHFDNFFITEFNFLTPGSFWELRDLKIHSFGSTVPLKSAFSFYKVLQLFMNR